MCHGSVRFVQKGSTSSFRTGRTLSPESPGPRGRHTTPLFDYQDDERDETRSRHRRRGKVTSRVVPPPAILRTARTRGYTLGRQIQREQGRDTNLHPILMLIMSRSRSLDVTSNDSFYFFCNIFIRHISGNDRMPMIGVRRSVPLTG